MTRIPTAFACLAIGGVVLTGCGGGGGSGSAATTGGAKPATSSQAAPSTSGGSSAGKGGVVDVSAKDIKFVPASITVKKGQTIKWTNQDPVAHTVTADSGASFDSGTLNAGGTYTYTPTKAGKIHYFCTIHGQQQSGTITVTG